LSVFNRFHERLQGAIVNRLGWQSLRPVQELASEVILDGKNLVVLAPTAGGKTEAAFFPIISEMITSPEEGVKCIYISPIRALLNNQEERLGQYSEMVGLSSFKWHGEAKKSAKKAFIKEPDDILMITPESLEVMLISSSVPENKLFANLRFVVVDEIHALANCDRGAHLMSVLERIGTYSSHDVQRIGLSATVGNPEQILDWLQGSSKRDKEVIDPPKVSSGKQLEVKYLDESELAIDAASRGFQRKSLFFCNSRARTEKVAQAMRRRNIQIYVHHSSVSREEREKAEEAVSVGVNVSIICTSTLELGIDVGELDLIFQEECPSTVASFLQRMGRTGRRPGTKSNTTFYTTRTETMLQSIALIELARENWVEDVPLNNWSWHIMVHQLMAMCLQFGGTTRSKVWETVNQASCFSGIEKSGFEKLVNHMIKKDYLAEESGFLSMGLEAEKTFGRRNFMELYGVFSSPVSFSVVTVGGQPLGTIEWQFADQVEEGFCFLLAGSGWLVERLEMKTRTVWVSKAPAGKAPKWGGYAPNILSYEVCRRMYHIQTCDDFYPYCDELAKTTLEEIREDRRFLRHHFAPVEREGEHVYWWTFAGSRINNTLKYALAQISRYTPSLTPNAGSTKVVPQSVHQRKNDVLKSTSSSLANCPRLQGGNLQSISTNRDVNSKQSHVLSTEIISNNYYLKIRDTEGILGDLSVLIEEMRRPTFWEDRELQKNILAQLPMHRLSKFQDCLPEVLQVQLVAKELLDITGTIKFLNERYRFEQERVLSSDRRITTPAKALPEPKKRITKKQPESS
jgi:ATP-dependent Lhr-like helicase